MEREREREKERERERESHSGSALVLESVWTFRRRSPAQPVSSECCAVEMPLQRSEIKVRNAVFRAQARYAPMDNSRLAAGRKSRRPPSCWTGYFTFAAPVVRGEVWNVTEAPPQ